MYALLLSGIEETNAQQHNHRVSSKRRQYEGRRNSTKKQKQKNIQMHTDNEETEYWLTTVKQIIMKSKYN